MAGGAVFFHGAQRMFAARQHLGTPERLGFAAPDRMLLLDSECQSAFA
jgi:hypothetical protein